MSRTRNASSTLVVGWWLVGGDCSVTGRSRTDSTTESETELRRKQKGIVNRQNLYLFKRGVWTCVVEFWQHLQRAMGRKHATASHHITASDLQHHRRAPSKFLLSRIGPSATDVPHKPLFSPNYAEVLCLIFPIRQIFPITQV